MPPHPKPRFEYDYDVSPITDDSPFFWHFTSFADPVTDVSWLVVTM